MGKNLKGKELGKGISQRKDNYYVGRINTPFGTRQKIFKNLNECKQWVIDTKYEVTHNNCPVDNNITLNTWYKIWLSQKQKTTRKKTCIAYESIYQNHIRQIIGNMIIRDILPLNCQMVIFKAAEKGLRVSTLNRIRAVMFNIFDEALINEILNKNPCLHIQVKNIGKPKQDNERFLTREEQRDFLNIIKNYEHQYQFQFVLQTGLRYAELTGLKWEDIDFKNKTMDIKRTVYQVRREWLINPPKTPTSIRTIPLTDEAIKILLLQKEKNSRFKEIPKESVGYVFLGRRGNLVMNKSYNRALENIAPKIGDKKISMHILRHTFATRCIEAGMKPKTLQMILGHSNLQITMDLYVHVSNDEKKKEMEVIEQALKLI